VRGFLYLRNMKKSFALICYCFLVVSCVSSSGVTKTPTPQEQEAQQKQALKARITTTMAEQNRRIDSLIAAKDPRLKKDNNGKHIRPNWVSASGKPLYYSTDIRSARKAIKADAVNTGGNLGLNLNGEGIHLGIWDAGHIFASHDAFTGGADYFGYQVPIEIADANTANVIGGHPTAVASIVIAKGILENENYEITGVAPSLDKVYSYDWENDITEIFEQLQTDNNPDFILSNHSYGYPLEDQNGELLPDEFIGDYSEWSSILDNITYAYPYYVHIAAGGNDGNVSYPTQEVTGLDQLTGSTTGKNVLTVGSFSMDDNSENFTPTGFSSAGPTNDFRIKPEITAPGQQLGAAYWDENNPDFTDFYVVTSGTSFAAPATAGGIALLQQLYKRIHNTYMRGATVKALLCHTAQDIVVWSGQDITGPDVKTGYGAINIAAAASIIEQDETATNTLLEFQLLEGETKTLYMTILEAGALKATLSWYDPHAPKDAANTLINDLDLRITQEDTTYFPWKLPTDTQQVVAVLGDNAADNIEQIRVSENLGGIYEIAISHKGTLQGGTQQASLVLTGPGVIIPSKTALENASIDGFLVTPNPVSERFSVAVLDNSLSFRSLQLIDMSGREVARTSKASFSRASLLFEVAFLPKGVYILGIETKKNTTFKQIVIY
jgi:serine protease AprX